MRDLPPPPGAGTLGTPHAPDAAMPHVVEAPRRLHPLSMVRDIRVRGLLGGLTGLFVLVRDVEGVVVVLLGVAVLVLTAAARWVGWRRHTYELTGDRIVERTGVLSRSERTLELARIQQVDVQRNVLDRLVGTAELRLETAADSSDSEISLTVVGVEEADRLRQLLAAATRGARSPATTIAPAQTGAALGGDATTAATPGAVPAPGDRDAPASDDGELLVAVPLRHVALATATGRRLLLLPAGAFVLLGVLDDIGLSNRAEDVAGDLSVRLGILGTALLVLVGSVIALLATVVAGVLRDGNWSLHRRGDALRVRRGLTTERTATLPLGRVQRVTVDRSWLRGLLGFAAVTIHSAGGVGGATSTTEQLDRQLTVPLLPEGEVAALVAAVLGAGAATPPALERHPAAAGRRALVRGVLGVAAPAGAALLGAIALAFVVDPADLDVLPGALRPPLLVAVAVVLVVLGGLTGWLAHRRRASGTSAALVVARTGLLGTSTTYTPRRKVQGVTRSASWFQRRRGLATLAVLVAGPFGVMRLVDLAATDAAALGDALASPP